MQQEIANALIAMEKEPKETVSYIFPASGGKIIIPLISCDRQEDFSLDIYKKGIKLEKTTYQHRTQNKVILVRLDLGGRPHTNPIELGGEKISCPHLHIYRENFDDKYAIFPPSDHFKNLDDIFETLHNFMQYCNIIKKPLLGFQSDMIATVLEEVL